ncbi:uncharacterized protein [Nicotiana tomentosiformis]|uniref:uncharacterized protein n=1 Tax=Nicotiana tomentosiformis TaxID=4098 RepID=UPI00388C34F2
MVGLDQSSSHVPTVHVVPIIPTSTIFPSPKIIARAPELPAKNTFKSTKVRATPRKSVKKVTDAATQGDTVSKEYVVHGELVKVTTDQVQHPPSKLDVLVSAINVTPPNTLPPTSEKLPVKKFTVEKGVGDLGKEVDTTAMEPVVEGRGESTEPVQKEAFDGLSFSWTKGEENDGGEKEEEALKSHEEHDAQNIANEEEKSENEGASGNEKESDTKDKTGEHANDSTEEENQSAEEDVSEREGEVQEKVSGSEGGDEESEEEEGDASEESEESMTIGNNVIALQKKLVKRQGLKNLGLC